LPAVPHRAMKWRGAIALVAVMMLAAGIGQTSAGHAMLRKAGLFEAPASYTSLAFQDPRSLPLQVSRPRAAVPVSFMIHNSTGVSRNYQWTVQLGQQTVTSVASGNVRLAAGHGRSITRTAQISCTQKLVRIAVSLADPAESIDAWVTCQHTAS